MTLKELEQQIVSEAVKAFREKFTATQDGKPILVPPQDVEPIESFLTDQLHQATWKVAEETVSHIAGGFDGTLSQIQDDKLRKIAESIGVKEAPQIIKERSHSWLNHNSEEKCAEKDCNNKRLPPNDFCQFHCDNLPF